MDLHTPDSFNIIKHQTQLVNQPPPDYKKKLVPLSSVSEWSYTLYDCPCASEVDCGGRFLSLVKNPPGNPV